MIQQVLAGAPACSKVIVAGVCMEPDSFLPSVAILKEIDLIFTIAFTLEEYQEVLGHLASGALQVAPMVTDRVGLAEVPEAFARLSKPGQDVKIVVVPAGH
ncbi:MDR/zinc-dependent alcohol dehydrogenase-like family protein [Streptomyces chartreusis]|uniref:hypothetical protein n=1 Tax=Streptomyces chartreusis TaxID=1969 RepID=UPI003633E44D